MIKPVSLVDSPQAWDLVLGGQATVTAPTVGLVLGGLAGVRRRLQHPDVSVRLAVLPEILHYGEAGLDLLITVLQTNTEWPVRLAVWKILSELDHPQAQQAICELSPFRPVGGSAGLLLAYRRGERDFSYADLPQAHVSGVSLGGSRFFQANLKGSSFHSVNFNGAQFQQADLRATDLSGSKLSGANFEGADLRETIALSIKCSGTNLRQVQLSDTSQWDPKLYQVWRLQNQGGRRQPLSQVDLAKTDLYKVDLQFSTLTEAYLEGVDLRQADLTGADLTGADLTRADLRGANLQGACLRNTRLIKANLEGANLEKADLTLANGTKANLNRANLTDANVDRFSHSEAKVDGLLFPDGTSSRPWWW